MNREIDYIIAVAECGSISKAAEVLYISQPSLSRYLTNLENELDVSLFVRTINGTELTEAGKIYVSYAKEIRRLQSTMKVKLKDLQKSGTHHIRIGMTLNSISLSAFNIAEKVKERYPACMVEIFNLMSKDIPQFLREGSYDFAIGPDLNLPQDLQYHNIYFEPYILVVPDRYDLETYAQHRDDLDFPLVDLRTLPKLDFILQDYTTAMRKSIDMICQKLNFIIHPKLIVTSSTIALQAVQNQMGCCIVALGHLAYLNHMEHLKFYQISTDFLSPTGLICLRTKTLVQPEVTYCITCIKESLSKGNAQLITKLKQGIA